MIWMVSDLGSIENQDIQCACTFYNMSISHSTKLISNS